MRKKEHRAKKNLATYDYSLSEGEEIDDEDDTGKNKKKDDKDDEDQRRENKKRGRL